MATNVYKVTDKPLQNYYEEIASRIKWDRGNPPDIAYVIGLARTGTSASLNVFRGSQVKDIDGATYPITIGFQILKAGLRHGMLDWRENPNWNFKIPKTPLFYMKHSIGPYTDEESRYNPLKVFEQMGFPLGKVFPIFLYRDPLDAFASWIDMWSSIIPRETLLENFITSSNTLREIREQTKTAGIPYATLLYESIRDNSPDETANALFDQINQRFFKKGGKRIEATEHTTKKWDELGRDGLFTDQPKVYEIPEIDERVHHDVKTKKSWEYKMKTPDMLTSMLFPEEVKRLEEAGVPQIYEEFRLDCEKTLGISIKESGSFKSIKEAFARKTTEGKVRPVNRK